MAQVTLTNDAVRIVLSTADKIWAVHGSLEIPLAHIKSARVEDANGWHHLWRKLAGTNAPGLKMAGTFWLPGGLAFLDYGSGRNCLVLTTEHETYKSVVVECDSDPAAAAAEINRRIGAEPS